MRWLAILPIALYRATISRIMPPVCRFDPTCAEYAQLALLRHGLIKGLAMGVRRMFKCHPWGSGGNDPVPDVTPNDLARLWPKARRS